TGGRCAKRNVKNGARKCPTKGAPTTIATSVGVPPMRRTTTGMNATSTDTKEPARTGEKTTRGKVARTRGGCQLESVTRPRYRARDARVTQPRRAHTGVSIVA